MRQTTLSVVLEVEPASVGLLSKLIEDLKNAEVRGPGVVGEQPQLAPGEAFEYTSGCPLETPFGSMRGTYQCVAEDGTHFEVPIAEFLLTVPRTLH